MRALWRLHVRLPLRPTSVTALRWLAGNLPDGSAGDVRAIPTAPRYESTAEARVVQRLRAWLQRSPADETAMKSFLGDPSQGGGPEDLRVVADMQTFLGRHKETFSYDAATRTLSLNRLSDGQMNGTDTERLEIQRLKAKLRSGPVDINQLKDLMHPNPGSNKKDKDTQGDFLTFLLRYHYLFNYDETTRRVSLQDPVEPTPSSSAEKVQVDVVASHRIDTPVEAIVRSHSHEPTYSSYSDSDSGTSGGSSGDS